MKNLNALLIISLLVIFTSCSKNMLTMSVTEPAPVSISPDIKKVGIIDRSKASKPTENLDKIDKILSGEGKNLDKDGAAKTIKGLLHELNKNDRFSEVKTLNIDKIINPGIGVFPAALGWDKISDICKKNDVDALFVLSFYDTDSKIEYKAVPVEIVGPLGIKIKAIEHHATIITTIKTGWRIYDYKAKLISDEILLNELTYSIGKGINPISAAEAIIGRKEAVMQASTNIGYTYASRILPYRIRVSREYYVKGSQKFKIGKRRAQTGDWDGAADLWLEETSNPKRKISGRACYNMAIYNEINGNLEGAYEWASKSYTYYKNKTALRYLNVLKIRMNRLNELNYQMNY